MKRYSAPITAPLILEHMRNTKALEYKKQIIGNLGGLYGCLGVSADSMASSAEQVLLGEIASAQNDSQHPLWKSYHRNRDLWDSAL